MPGGALPVMFILKFCINLRTFVREIWVTVPEESQLQHGCATQLKCVPPYIIELNTLYCNCKAWGTWW